MHISVCLVGERPGDPGGRREPGRGKGGAGQDDGTEVRTRGSDQLTQVGTVYCC